MNNERQIAKQKFDEHFMFKDNPIAWTAWKMAFQLGIEHERLLHKTPCTALRELLAKMYEEENEVLSNAVCNNLYEREKHANRKYCIAIVMMMLDVRQPVE